jgi:protein-tyrosine sulfotransferase
MTAPLLQAARRPRFVLRNLRYHVGLEPSPEEHVFVLGPPRSGTTLVRQMLLAHPLLTGPDKETFFFLRWNLSDFAVDEIPPDQMAEIRAHSPDSIRLFDGIASWMKNANGARGFVEKSPQHALRLSFLRRYFPRSRFIFVCRDPRDGFISARRNPHMRTMTADEYAKLWLDCVMTRLKQPDSARIFDLRYEDLCAAPERHLRSMMTFLGYDMVPEQLSPQRYSVTALSRRPGHARLNQAIGSDTVGAWRRALPTELKVRLERIAGPQMRVLRYSSETPFHAGA